MSDMTHDVSGTALVRVLERRRLILTVAALLALAGAVMWATMVRQEDPRLPDFWGQVVTPYPGADAETVERQVLEPIEDALAEVTQIKEIAATASDEMAILIIELRGDTADIDEAWDEVAEALEEARREFPSGAGEPVLDEDQQDQDSIVLAVTGSPDPLALRDAARRLEDELQTVPLVARVELVADPGEQVTIDLDDAVARRLDLGPAHLAARLSRSNLVLAGGSLCLDGRSLRLRPLSEFQSLEEIAATPVLLASGSAVPLAEVARVHRGPSEPAASRMRFNGEMSVGLAVTPREAINLVSFGTAVRAKVAAVAPELAPVEVREVTFQPERTQARLADLNRSLLFAVLIVAGVLVLAMGPRLGLLVASVVPLVAMASLALFAWGGGVLHQISIAALVLALGMLVDNAIVVAENVQWRLDLGASPGEAAVQAVSELAKPLAGATATTLAAFIPMLIADGPTAVFTRSIPVVVMLTLTVSYLFAVLVTPVLARLVLTRGSAPATRLTTSLGRRLAGAAVRRPGLVLVAAGLLVVASLMGSGKVRRQFFPSADRNQLLVDVELPEGAHLDATDAASRTLERALSGVPEVTSVAAFIGRSAPKFYYNITRVPYSPHVAQLIVETRDTDEVEGVLDWIRSFVHTTMPEVQVVARKLEQGPPVEAPVEARLFGRDLTALHSAAVAVAHELEQVDGSADVRHDLGPGAPTLRVRIDDAAAARNGLTRADVATALYGLTRGLPVGELRSGDDPIPVRVRSTAGERTPAERLESTNVVAPDGHPVPLGQVATLEPAWRPATIRHRDASRVVTVSSQLAPGFTFSQVLSGLRPRLEAVTLPAGVEIAFGGDAEGSGEANSELMRSLPIGALLLLGVLLAEFNSFRRMGLILVTVPLAAAGVVPGLLLGDQPFGFMSLLGVIALVGIVVNNAIVLLEVVESRRREGASVDEALSDAVTRRIRPILLTTATTVAGLLPLALSSSTLWPPLAWAMISGLLASTLLTLVVVPALYRVLLGADRRPARQGAVRLAPAAAAAIIVLAGMAAEAAEPVTVSLHESMALSRQRPAGQAALLRARAAEHAATSERRAALFPTLAVAASVSERDRGLSLVTPLGDFPLGRTRAGSAAVELVQPLVDTGRLLCAAPAARQQARAARYQAERTRQALAADAGHAHLDVLAIDARIRATGTYVSSLEARLDEMAEMVRAGRALEADALKVSLALDQARQDLLELSQARAVAAANLARAVGHVVAVEPLPAPDLGDRTMPLLDTAKARALDQRPDLAALRRTREALDMRRAAVRAEALPRLEARARWTWSDGTGYAQDSWTEGVLTLSWSPYAAGTRGPRTAALAAESDALEREIEELRRSIEVEIRAALAELESAHGALQVGERGVEQARETLRVERERHHAGRATTNDLLDAEATLRERRTLRDLARLDVVRAWIELDLAIGEDAVASAS